MIVAHNLLANAMLFVTLSIHVDRLDFLQLLLELLDLFRGLLLFCKAMREQRTRRLSSVPKNMTILYFRRVLFDLDSRLMCSISSSLAVLTSSGKSWAVSNAGRAESARNDVNYLHTTYHLGEHTLNAANAPLHSVS